MSHRAMWGGPRVSQEEKKPGENVGSSLHCSFCEKGKPRQSEQVQDWLIQIISVVSGDQGLFLVVWYLALGDRAKEKKPDRGGGSECGCWTSWFTYESVLLGKTIVISKNWVALEGVSLWSVRPQMSEHQEYSTQETFLNAMAKHRQPARGRCHFCCFSTNFLGPGPPSSWFTG